MTALAHTPRYGSTSRADSTGLTLAADVSGDAPAFLRGTLVHPQPFATAMTALGEVVTARHHVPPAMLQRILAEADPVVTVGAGTTRFEGFSACCGCYARVDLLADGLEADRARHGTTNVDFSAPLRRAMHGLALVGGATLSVDAEGLEVSTDQGQVTERRIPLPTRWLRAFLAVGLIQRRLEPGPTWSAAQARRLLGSLPRDASFKAPTWLVPAATGFRLSSRPATDGVRVSGPSRLRALEAALRHATSVRVWRDPADQASGWVVDAPGCRLTLLLSADPWRGLSGEGQGLLEAGRAEGLASARAALSWRQEIPPDGADADALAALSAQGLVGWDLASGRWFHRELPFRPERLETLLPRLKDARNLLADPDAVRVEAGGRVAWVRGSAAEHRVDLSVEPAVCTCTWYARTRGAQGPCKHVLAASLRVEETP